jgi:hypothetical protein
MLAYPIEDPRSFPCLNTGVAEYRYLYNIKKGRFFTKFFVENSFVWSTKGAVKIPCQNSNQNRTVLNSSGSATLLNTVPNKNS